PPDQRFHWIVLKWYFVYQDWKIEYFFSSISTNFKGDLRNGQLFKDIALKADFKGKSLLYSNYDPYFVPHLVHYGNIVFSRIGKESFFMKIYGFPDKLVVQVPIHPCSRFGMCQFKDQLPFFSLKIFGERYSTAVLRIDKRHIRDAGIPTIILKGWQYGIRGMATLII